MLTGNILGIKILHLRIIHFPDDIYTLKINNGNMWIRARLHETRSELKPVWDLKPLWKMFLFTWRFYCGNFPNCSKIYCTCANDLGAIISNNQKKARVNYDVYCMKAREIYNNIRVVTNQTSVFKDYQHEPRSNQSNTNMCWLSCFISCDVSCFPERASSMNWGRKILQ